MGVEVTQDDGRIEGQRMTRAKCCSLSAVVLVRGSTAHQGTLWTFVRVVLFVPFLFFNVKKGCIFDISTEQNSNLHPAGLSNVVLDIQGLN